MKDLRMEKLTALARMAWPYRPLEVRCVEVHPLVNGEVWEVIEAEDDEEVCYLRASSLDGLEAALLVESGETSLRALERAGLPESGPWQQLRAAEAKLAKIARVVNGDDVCGAEEPMLYIAGILDDRVARPPEDKP